MKKALWLTILVLLPLAACKWFKGEGGDGAPESEPSAPVERPMPAVGFYPEDYHKVEGKIRSGDYFTKWMTSIGVHAQAASAFAADSTFDVRRLRAGNAYEAYYRDSLSTEPLYVVYIENSLSSVVFSLVDSLSVRRVGKEIELRRNVTDVTISSSMWKDMQDAGAPVSLISSLSDIYAWTVDFFALQDGDRFRVLYDEVFADGEFIRADTVRYAEYIHGETVIPAIMFNQHDDGNIYWGESGESLRKAFLKAPLEFKRISSGFSYARKHPVHGDVRPHTGVDYAAPTGTPVVTIGDGTVISMGWGGGGGNTVKIRHNSTYTTGYLHLSKYAAGMKVGDHVQQGQVIGYVGATGTATGPHLDFRVWKNGTPINPLTMDSPPADPIDTANLQGLRLAAETSKAELEERLKAR